MARAEEELNDEEQEDLDLDDEELEDLDLDDEELEDIEDPDDEEEPPPLADDPDESDRGGPAPTDPGITTTDDTIPCPYCGEPIDLFLEPLGDTPKQEFVEECPACSRDVEITVEYDSAGTPHVHAGRAE
ncbi:MAG TPA: CPXCG motif-containing cysteine-rich protein [Gemmatimonadota bacterium]|nr:CPXCG motif-containing cysteine-rich protein [Gemmatimonadota bacterium]